jgi:hypothetical protein
MLIRQRRFGYKALWIFSWKDHQNPQNPATTRGLRFVEYRLGGSGRIAAKTISNPIDLRSEKMIGASGHSA